MINGGGEGESIITVDIWLAIVLVSVKKMQCFNNITQESIMFSHCRLPLPSTHATEVPCEKERGSIGEGGRKISIDYLDIQLMHSSCTILRVRMVLHRPGRASLHQGTRGDDKAKGKVQHLLNGDDMDRRLHGLE
jgi:hypothetical protein